MNKQEYYDMYKKLQDGVITEEVWREFCTKFLSELLDSKEMKDMLVRLKNR